MPSILRCSGCGAAVDIGEALPFRCPRAGEAGEHVLARRLVLDGTDRPRAPAADDPEAQPFVRYRELLHPYAFARARAMSDAAYVALVRELDAAVAAVDGHGFRRTPLLAAPVLDRELGLPAGTIAVKDETGNVAGSHKGRHLFGVAVQLEVAHRVGALDRWPPRLAIASCGNAALAAAVIAAAARWPLTVYVPPDADPTVLARLAALGAEIVPCPREPDGPPGDPCVRGFRDAVAGGAVPFSCQGPDNGLAIDGGRTLAYELVEHLAGEGPSAIEVYVQVGGGALASAVAAGFADAVALGQLARAPRLMAVQAEGAAPLARAYRKVARAAGMPAAPTVPDDGDKARIDAALADAARRRGDYMWPWEAEPASAASGILDDETYDWWAVVRALLHSGGAAVVAPEALVRAAHELGTATGVRVDATGTAGLAGLLHELAQGRRPAAGTRVVLLFTGADRSRGGGSAPG